MKKFPNAFTIMLGVILLAWLSTFLIPAGAYVREPDPETGRMSVVPDSYTAQSADSLGVIDLLRAIPEGLASRADLIALILLIGGCFYIIEKSGVLGQGLQRIVDLLRGREALAIVVVSLLFATAGATIGLQEEVIAMAPVLVMFSRSMGYNALLALAMSFGSAILGAAFSPMNPFAVLMAQQEAGLPLMSGALFRVGVLAVALAVWIAYLLRYARRNPVEKVPMDGSHATLGPRGLLIFGLLVATFGLVTYGLLQWDWGFNELSGCFFALGITAGLLSGMGMERTGMTYAAGFREMIFAGVIIGLAGSISLLLKKGVVIDTLVYALFTPMESLPNSLSALGMMLGQSLLHIPVPSYSGQAILTMPILTPLSDLAGIPRQVCVLAYQYGSVNMDLLAPTNGALMAILAVCNIPYNEWLRFIWKPALLLFAVASGAILLALQIGLA
ncbi:YfcC family protein [Robiginitalea sp. M366]|uniref:YfcC family protein n=1 Tax=Robiginitalea aestuariiviva TaxID=3036903 RepID=UPI00240D6590|nr:YfcC family protein [Robiginitalea aestuariiviva]MDG1572254.1 YfcC family protein [Robiginitalea aestuariiviva]